MKIKILLVDDHDVAIVGMRSILQQERTIEVVGEAEHGRAALQLVGKLSPDIVLMDISMPEMNGIEATRQIMGLRTRVKVIAQSMHTDEGIVIDMLKAGATGYLCKRSMRPHLLPAIRAVADGETYLCPEAAHIVLEKCLHHAANDPTADTNVLTSREREVLQLLAEGKTSKAIASILSITQKTVESHRARLMEKINIHTVAGLTKFAIRHGWTSVED